MSSALNAIVGQSPAIVALRNIVRTIASSKVSVLIEGPTGSGKELVAAAIHEVSGRRGPFVAFNVCAIGETMFEDAMFGHVRGAFTNATSETPGYLREAHGGTVFLDEIGGLPLQPQVKLLRALETGVFRPVGGRCDARSDFRTVAATNERVRDLVASGRLRADLVYRMSGATIVVPPLVDRLADIPSLVEHFARRAEYHGHLDDATVAALSAHTWPGNVRELRNVVECAIALGGLSVSAVQSVMMKIDGADVRAPSKQHWRRAVLEAHQWNADSVAQSLGVHRTTAFRWKREFRPDPRDIN